MRPERLSVAEHLLIHRGPSSTEVSTAASSTVTRMTNSLFDALMRMRPGSDERSVRAAFAKVGCEDFLDRAIEVGILRRTGLDYAGAEGDERWPWSAASAIHLQEFLGQRWFTEEEEEAALAEAPLEDVGPAQDPGIAAPIRLPDPAETEFRELARRRRSNRAFDGSAIDAEPLSGILACGLALTGWLEIPNRGRMGLRMAPSPGSRTAIDGKVLVRSVNGVEPGTYRYCPVERLLCCDQVGDPNLAGSLGGQEWADSAAAVVLLVAEVRVQQPSTERAPASIRCCWRRGTFHS